MPDNDVLIRLAENGSGSQVVVATSQPSGIVCLFAVDVDVTTLEDTVVFELIPVTEVSTTERK
jgi:hypothetical protein